MPTKQRVGRDDRAKRAQPLAPRRLAFSASCRRSAFLKMTRRSTDVCAKYAVLAFQGIDCRRLLSLQPTGN
jgi:hypothetical protein